MRGLLIALPVLLLACSSSPNHVGNPLTLPVRGVINSIQNANYEAKRAKVSALVNENTAQIHADISAGGGSLLSEAMDLAGVHEARRSELSSELMANPDIYVTPDTEPLVVAIMVYGE